MIYNKKMKTVYPRIIRIRFKNSTAQIGSRVTWEFFISIDLYSSDENKFTDFYNQI